MSAGTSSCSAANDSGVKELAEGGYESYYRQLITALKRRTGESRSHLHRAFLGRSEKEGTTPSARLPACSIRWASSTA